MFELHHGKAEQVLANIPENTFHSIVTDPPYGLKFMGKKWDYDVPSVLIWQAIYRSLKPGGYLIAFSGTRTYHRMAVNIEDAGFQIRDMISWVYGSGFPKSHNISKSIDKAAGNEPQLSNGSSSSPNGKIGGYEGERYKQKRETIFGTVQDQPDKYSFVSPEAQQWDGWGSALKPAVEPIVIAQKPFKGTIAANVLKHGVGGINIDACRVGLNGEKQPSGSAKLFLKNNEFTTDKIYGDDKTTPLTGRFPANFIHDGSPEVVSLFPSKAGANAPVINHHSSKSNGIYNDYDHKGGFESTFYNDLGSAARFFYCAKASPTDRNEGCNDIKPVIDTDRQNDSIDLANRLHNKSKSLNNHPTVKPTTLMRYLVRLVTPPNGIVCDPFCGSGSTGKACIAEGFRFVGIDLDPHNIAISHARITHAIKQSTPTPNFSSLRTPNF